MFCARLFICASWSPAGKGLTSWLSFVVSSVSLSLSHWYPGSGVVLDCIDSWSLQPYLLLLMHICYSKIHFLQLGPFKLIKTTLNSLNVLEGLSQVLNRYPKGSHNTWATWFNYRVWLINRYNLQRISVIRISSIWSTEMIIIAWTYPARDHYKNAYFSWLYNLTPTWFMTNFL